MSSILRAEWIDINPTPSQQNQQAHHHHHHHHHQHTDQQPTVHQNVPQQASPPAQPAPSVLNHVEPAIVIEQCRSFIAPSTESTGNHEHLVEIPTPLSGLYVRRPTKAGEAHIMVATTKKPDGEVHRHSIPVVIHPINECEIPQAQFTHDPAALRAASGSSSATKMYHADCLPQCHKLCEPGSENCARCVDTFEGFECACAHPYEAVGQGPNKKCVLLKPAPTPTPTPTPTPATPPTAPGTSSAIPTTTQDSNQRRASLLNQKKEKEGCATNPCSPNAVCHNQPNSQFSCTCKSGFEGDGFKCHDINECLSHELHHCPTFSNCVNKEGGYTCECIPGYVSHNGQCLPDPCLTTSNPCPSEEFKCVPTFVSTLHPYDCVCINRTKTSYNGRCIPSLFSDPAAASPISLSSLLSQVTTSIKKATHRLTHHGKDDSSLTVDEEFPEDHKTNFPKLSKIVVNQCQSLVDRFPRGMIPPYDVQVDPIFPKIFHGDYAANITSASGVEVPVRFTDKFGRLSYSSVPVTVVDIDECSIPALNWTTDPLKLSLPKSPFYHSDCMPNCYSFCVSNPETKNLIPQCENTIGSYRCLCLTPVQHQQYHSIGSPSSPQAIGHQHPPGPVDDRVPPSIQLNKGDHIQKIVELDCAHQQITDLIRLEDYYNDNDVVAFDDHDKELTSKIERTVRLLDGRGSYTSPTYGLVRTREWTIHYQVSDSKGNLATAHRKVTIDFRCKKDLAGSFGLGSGSHQPSTPVQTLADSDLLFSV